MVISTRSASPRRVEMPYYFEWCGLHQLAFRNKLLSGHQSQYWLYQGANRRG